MSLTFRNYVRDINIADFVIEIMDNMLIIGNNKIMTPDTGEAMAGFLDKISRLA